MGSNCSSGHKDRDSISTRSEESPSYQASKKLGEDKTNKKSTETHKHRSANGERKSSADGTKPGSGQGGGGTSIGAGVVLGVNVPKPAHQSSMKKDRGATQNRLLDLTIRQEDSLIDPIQAKIPKVVLYVCTADSQDFKVEKSQLHTGAAVELRALCSSRGFELYLVDLHWSVQDKAVEPEELCLKELTRQSEYYIVPVVFLDSTLGEQLLPKNVESADFESAAESDKDDLLKKWYKLDGNTQPPCYTLLTPSTHIPGLKEENQEKGLNLWRQEKNAILSTFLGSFSQELRDTYLTTTLEREVQHTVLISQELAKRCVWFTRGSKSGGGGESAGELEARRRLEALQKTLKNELSERNISTLTSEQSASTDLVKILKRVINEVMDDHESKLDTAFSAHMLRQDDKENGGRKKGDDKDDLNLAWSKWPAILERARQLDRAWVIARWSVERRHLIDTLTKQSGSVPILLVGPRGSGKTTTLSKFLLRTSGPSSTVYLTFRSAHLTSSSIDLESILRSLVEELNPSEFSLSHDVDSLAKQFNESLVDLSTRKNYEKRKFYICIDGLDELGSSANVAWIPKELPDNVSMILSCREDGRYFEKLKDSTFVIKLQTLNEDEAQNVFTTSFLEYNRDVSKEIQERAFKMLNSCRLPLYVKVTAWLFAVEDKFDVIINYQDDLNGQLEEMLNTLERLLGRTKVERCLSLILASRWGLRDSEMIDLLAEDDVYRNSSTYLPRAGAILFWTELVRVLGLYMFLETSAHSGALRLKDSALVELVGSRYSATIKEAANRLLKYFGGIEDDSKAEATRKYEEIMQLSRQTKCTSSELWNDPGFLIRLIRSVGVNQLLKDLGDEVFVSESSDFLRWLVRFFAVSAEALTSDVAQFRTQIERNFHEKDPGGVIPKAWRDKILMNDSRETYLAEIHCAKDEPEDSPASLDIIRRLPNLKNHVVGVKSSLGEISVYDVMKCKKVRNLSGLTQPAALEMIDDYKCVVLCNRELITYDLDKGVLLTKLKGVMNQKMPYFGLHDSNHLVAFSRNRMYVNLMNLDSGDCVTTFKAGEDRFLNSLLVSADGKTLVCGDETQKPFPLLVWSLASRKLLYDLRIPQHEFISRLSAITPQGNFVCCVAKEVDDSSPNYIVVYDLQSGTLFKKWKPSVGTTSIDISHAESLLVSGHVNCKILCWSLGTGNCLHCLTGHTAPVDLLRLSPDGRKCLSLNSKGLDRSVRIWDLSQGQQIAVFTPDAPVTACELTNRWVLLSVKNQPRLICLEIRGGSGSQSEREDEPYGR